MNPNFMVLGLPRSGTTWLANWLTTDRSLCLHDPFNELPEHWPRDDRRWGISCTGSYLLKGWVERQSCPVAVIERDPMECRRSLRALYPDGEVDAFVPALNAVRGRRWQFADLWEERTAQALWEYLLPGLPFDAIRYRLLREMNVQCHKWEVNAEVVGELIKRGLMEGPALAKEKAKCPGGMQQQR
jgi:hypothetical protein